MEKRTSLPPSLSLSSSLPLSLAHSLLLLCMYVLPWQSHVNTAVEMVTEGDSINLRGDRQQIHG